MVEVSGKERLNFQGQLDLSSDTGIKGQLYLDPRHVYIRDGSSEANDGDLPSISESTDSGLDYYISSSALVAALESADVTVEATSNFTVEDTKIAPSSGTFNLAMKAGNNFTSYANSVIDINGNLTIEADNNVYIYGALKSDQNITITADKDGNNSGNISTNTTNTSARIEAADTLILSAAHGIGSSSSKMHTSGVCFASDHAGLRIMPKISTCATDFSNSVKSSKTSLATSEASGVEKTVLHITSAVR